MSIDPIHAIHAIDPISLPPLPLNSKRPQRLQINTPERAVLGSLEVDPGHSAPRDAPALERPERLEPAARAEAPLAAAAEPHGPEVVALAGGVVEEVLGDDSREGVVAAVQGAGAAVAVAVEARHGLC